jgi:hypothetical protein
MIKLIYGCGYQTGIGIWGSYCLLVSNRMPEALGRCYFETSFATGIASVVVMLISGKHAAENI